MEWHVSGPVWQSKGYSQKRSMPHWWQAISCNTQQGYGHIVPVVAAYYGVITSVQGSHYVQGWPRHINYRLASPGTNIQKTKTNYYWHEYKCECHQCLSKYASMHISRRHTCGNTLRCLPHEAKIIHNNWMATQKHTLKHSIRHYWPLWSELVMIDVNAMKDKLHGNHMGTEMMRL